MWNPCREAAVRYRPGQDVRHVVTRLQHHAAWRHIGQQARLRRSATIGPRFSYDFNH